MLQIKNGSNTLDSRGWQPEGQEEFGKFTSLFYCYCHCPSLKMKNRPETKLMCAPHNIFMDIMANLSKLAHYLSNLSIVYVTLCDLHSYCL